MVRSTESIDFRLRLKIVWCLMLSLCVLCKALQSSSAAEVDMTDAAGGTKRQ